MKWHFNDPTAEDYDQIPLTPQERKAVLRACAVMGAILIIGLIILIKLLC
jgi:hypothetical protein